MLSKVLLHDNWFYYAEKSALKISLFIIPFSSIHADGNPSEDLPTREQEHAHRSQGTRSSLRLFRSPSFTTNTYTAVRRER